MFCPNCGSKLPDGSKFCDSCGANLSLDAESNSIVDENQTVAVETTMPSTTGNSGSEFVQFHKKGNKKKLMSIILIAAVAIIALFVLKSLFAGGNSNNAYVYVSDGKYELLTNIEKDEYIEIASGKNDIVSSNMLAFSPDGKFIYYYTKYDSSTGTGSLCRAEYGKLKENTSKNDKYIEVIATNVSLGFSFLDDGSVIYQNGSGTLYYYNNEESTQIAKTVNYYYTDGVDRVVYVTGDSGEGYTMYGVKLSAINDKVKLASNFSYIHDATDFDNILYTKQEDDSTATLYVVGFEKDSEKLGEDVNILTTVDGKTYFTEANGFSLNLYEYVTDDYAETDSGITEPNRDDFVVPKYSYEMIYGSNVSESDFEELYTSCTKDLYWYGESTWYSYSMEEALSVDWGDDTDGIHTATQNFIDKYASTADENGYILVTDEVKAALKEINKYGANDWEWMWLCYNKYQSGTTIDYDAYNDASDKWYEAKNRIEMREQLQNKENDYSVRTLYCFEKGKLTAINENVLSTRTFDGAIMFNTSELIADTVYITDVNSISSVTQLFNINCEAQNYIVSTQDSSVYQMSASAAEAYAEGYEEYNASLYFADAKIYMGGYSEDAALSVASITNNQIDDFTLLTDEAVVVKTDGSTVFYVSEYYTNNDLVYCDIYSYDGKESKRLAQDVLFDSIKLYEDGVVLAYTGYRNYSGYELTLFNSKGEKTIIGDNITQYIRVDKSTLFYITDGDLYLYDGKEKKFVHSDVEWLWSMNFMDVQHSFGNYDYDYYY